MKRSSKLAGIPSSKSSSASRSIACSGTIYTISRPRFSTCQSPPKSKVWTWVMMTSTRLKRTLMRSAKRGSKPTNFQTMSSLAYCDKVSHLKLRTVGIWLNLRTLKSTNYKSSNRPLRIFLLVLSLTLRKMKGRSRKLFRRPSLNQTSASPIVLLDQLLSLEM